MSQPQTQGLYSNMSLRQIKRAMTHAFQHASISFAQEDALDLIMAAAGVTRAQIITSTPQTIAPEIIARLEDYTQRRISGEPVDHILGWREFYGRRFTVNADVLSPRADTENLVTHALHALADINAPRILDLGTGSGAILLSLLAEQPSAHGIGIDVSQEALDIAQKNAQSLSAVPPISPRAAWLCGSWFEPLERMRARETTKQNADYRFDAIVSNPPYITDIAMNALEPEVKNYDPHLALSGGEDGLRDYRHIINCARDWLTPRGWLGVEIGFDQSREVSTLMREAEFEAVQTHKDLGGHPRIICARAPA